MNESLEDRIRKLYASSNEELKKSYEEHFPELFPQIRPITERIRTILDVYKINGTEQEPEFMEVRPELRRFMLAEWKWAEIVAAYNEGQRCDQSDSNVYRYRAVWWIKKDLNTSSGFAFHVSYCTNALTYAGVGSRHEFISSAHALDAANKFKDVLLERSIA